MYFLVATTCSATGLPGSMGTGTLPFSVKMAILSSVTGVCKGAYDNA